MLSPLQQEQQKQQQQQQQQQQVQPLGSSPHANVPPLQQPMPASSQVLLRSPQSGTSVSMIPVTASLPVRMLTSNVSTIIGPSRFPLRKCCVEVFPYLSCVLW